MDQGTIIMSIPTIIIVSSILIIIWWCCCLGWMVQFIACGLQNGFPGRPCDKFCAWLLFISLVLPLWPIMAPIYAVYYILSYCWNYEEIQACRENERYKLFVKKRKQAERQAKYLDEQAKYRRLPPLPEYKPPTAGDFPEPTYYTTHIKSAEPVHKSSYEIPTYPTPTFDHTKYSNYARNVGRSNNEILRGYDTFRGERL
jgi:hypothetical protein